MNQSFPICLNIDGQDIMVPGWVLYLALLMPEHEKIESAYARIRGNAVNFKEDFEPIATIWGTF